MMRSFYSLALAGVLMAMPAHAEPARPPITGISHIAVYTADAAASDDYYSRILGARKAPDPEDAHGTLYYFSPRQFVEVLPLGPNPGLSRLAHVAWNTTDASGLRAYLIAHGQPGVSALRKAPDGGLWFETQDPEGNGVQFVQPASADAKAEPGAISSRIIHVGYMVRSRAAEDKFYRDLLGFRPYWHGAMNAQSTDWISQQVPNGHDWLEYMMVGPGSTTPLTKVDARELGVLNHFSLGVPNMEIAVTTLIDGNRQSPRHDGPSMGLDGKWQANLYDPDGTRAELMEFKPVTKPCCSDFTADSPSG
jgi:catechol 2,3-dioxygenase-like lactoylglutathione lyase family enzyme